MFMGGIVAQYILGINNPSYDEQFRLLQGQEEFHKRSAGQI